MSLLDEFSEEYKIMEKTRTPDGEGGFVTTWTEGASVSMPMRHDSSIEAMKAEAEGVKSTYTFLSPKTLKLEYHDVLKRVSDGAVFRITSNSGDSFTPASSSLTLSEVNAERWELT